MSHSKPKRGGARPGAGRPRGSTKPPEEIRTSSSVYFSRVEREQIEIFRIATGCRSFGDAVRTLTAIGLDASRGKKTRL